MALSHTNDQLMLLLDLSCSRCLTMVDFICRQQLTIQKIHFIALKIIKLTKCCLLVSCYMEENFKALYWTLTFSLLYM